MYMGRYWQYDHFFPGLPIHVRVPRDGWNKVPLHFDPDDLGYNVFEAVSLCNMSAQMIPWELGIHHSLGTDEQRAKTIRDPTACEGMIKQELQHSMAQLFYSRAVERDLGYPRERRNQTKQDFARASVKKKQLRFLKLEASFVLKHMLLTTRLGRLKPATPNKWFYDWHWMEEAEHCWDSTVELRRNLMAGEPEPTRAQLIKKFLQLFLPDFDLLRDFIFAFMSGWLFGWRTLVNPVKFLSSLLVLLIEPTIFNSLNPWNKFFQIDMNMRPADEVYRQARARWHKEFFKEHEAKFQIIHVQEPHQHIRNQHHIKDAVNAIRALHAFKDRASPAPTELVRQISEGRERVYKSTLDELSSPPTSMTQNQIEEAGFGFLFHTAEGKRNTALG
eukprot:gb/GEZN01006799.1/.p1 GENE.gb/GEZN01006799.1/~~gb/GEZN01006799.1/.p1  ORF type:complete len:389 (+),score=43.69 gb/GEZN01006799.1/:94-1260(+)